MSDITLTVSLEQAEVLFCLLVDACNSFICNPEMKDEMAALHEVVAKAMDDFKEREMVTLPTLDEVRGILKPGDDHR